MVCNIHPVERVVRSLVGAGLLAIVFLGPKTPWGWIGIIPLATGLSGYCPPYQWLGINTAKARKE